MIVVDMRCHSIFRRAVEPLITPRATGLCVVAVVAVFLLWINFFIGAFPFAPIEGDDQGILNGLAEIGRGRDGMPSLAYSRELQPGTYEIVSRSADFFNVPSRTVFFITSLAAAAWFIVCSAWLGARIVGLGFVWILLGSLMSQEMVTAGAYANTSTIGGAFVISGLLVIEIASSWPALFLGALLMAIGGWARLDALALTPAALVILMRHRPVPSAIWRTLAVALLTTMTLLLLLLASGISVSTIWETFRAKGPVGGIWATLSRVYLLVGIFGLAASLGGLFWAGRNKSWSLVGFFFAVFIPLFAVHGRSFETPKYFYYGCPVLVWLILYLLAQLRRNFAVSGWSDSWPVRLMGLTVLTGFLIEPLVAVRTAPLDPPLGQTDSGIRIIAVSLPSGRIAEMVIGPGNSIPTSDGLRFRGGHFFAPFEWFLAKERVLSFNQVLVRVLDSQGNAVFVSTTYFTWQIMTGRLRELGFSPSDGGPLSIDNPSSRIVIWINKDNKITEYRINHTQFRGIEMKKVFDGLDREQMVFFLSDMDTHYNSEMMKDSGQEWRRVDAEGRGILALYERY